MTFGTLGGSGPWSARSARSTLLTAPLRSFPDLPTGAWHAGLGLLGVSSSARTEHAANQAKRRTPVAIAIIRGTSDKPATSDLLCATVDNWAHACPVASGKLYIGYPVIPTPGGPRRIDALLASETYGLVAIDLVQDDCIAGYQARQDDFANAIQSKLWTQSNLVRRSNGRRELVVPVHSVSFAPAVSKPPDDGDYPVVDESTLGGFLDALDVSASERDASSRLRRRDAFASAVSLLESMSAVRQSRVSRPPTTPQSRGAKLRDLERKVAILDHQQARGRDRDGRRRAAAEGSGGIGKDRRPGLEGRLSPRHASGLGASPVTFSTRSVKESFRHLVARFHVSQTTEIPDWDKLRIAHAWGGRGGPEDSGIYRDFCVANGATYLDFAAASSLAGPSRAFHAACRQALEEVETPKASFDAILIDQAHDLPPEFLAICYRSLTTEKRLVYAYDELQNLGSAPVKAPCDIFGPDVRWDEDVAESDIVLPRCYRNSRPILTTAHTLGFGIHRKAGDGESSGLVQMFDDVRMWRGVGYEAPDGAIREGAPVVLRRTDVTSPRFLEYHSPVDDLVVFKAFSDANEQDQWLVEQICKNLDQEELRPEDIVVVNPDPASDAQDDGFDQGRTAREGHP